MLISENVMLSSSESQNYGLANTCTYWTGRTFYAAFYEKGSRGNIMKGNTLRLIGITKWIDLIVCFGYQSYSMQLLGARLRLSVARVANYFGETIASDANLCGIFSILSIFYFRLDFLRHIFLRYSPVSNILYIIYIIASIFLWSMPLLPSSDHVELLTVLGT